MYHILRNHFYKKINFVAIHFSTKSLSNKNNQKIWIGPGTKYGVFRQKIIEFRMLKVIRAQGLEDLMVIIAFYRYRYRKLNLSLLLMIGSI